MLPYLIYITLKRYISSANSKVVVFCIGSQFSYLIHGKIYSCPRSHPYSLSIGKITPPKYIINNSLLPTVENIKDLGVPFSNTLSFNIHILSACRKCYCVINQIFRIVNCIVSLLSSMLAQYGVLVSIKKLSFPTVIV